MKKYGLYSTYEIRNAKGQRRNEEKVQEVLEEYIQNLIIGLKNIIDILEPQAICLGGSFVYFEEILYHRLIELYQTKRYVFNKQSLPELKLASLGNNAGIVQIFRLKSGLL